MSYEFEETDHPRQPNGNFAKASFDAVYDALAREVRRIDSLREADQVALNAALLAAKTAVEAALAAAEKAVAAALIAAKEAVNKAEIAQGKTNEGQNEFRGQLRDQASTFLPKTEYALAHSAMLDQIQALGKEMGNVRSRLDVGPPALATLQAESQHRGGQQAGVDNTWKIIFVVISAASGIFGAILTALAMG